MTTLNVKPPTNPRRAADWIAGKLPGDPTWGQLYYCTDGPDTLNTLATRFSGVPVDDGKLKVMDNLTWRTLAQFNFGTDDPAEINWYLREFNGCTQVDQNGNYALSKNDPHPFLYAPTAPVNAPTVVNVPPGTQVNVRVPPPQTELTQAAARRFRDIDLMKTGYLRRGDIINCLSGSSFTGVDGAMLATMFYKYSDMEDFSDDELGPETNGVTRADLVALDRIMNTAPTPKAQAVVAAYLYMKTKISLVGSMLYATPTIDPLMIAQGLVGDCWFLSAVVALKDRADALVRATIMPNGNNFTVKFKGDPKPIQVPHPTDAQIALIASTKGNGLWLSVLELAVGWRNDGYDPINGVDTGNFCGKGIELLTGGSVTTDTLSFTRDHVTRDKLEHALNGHKAVTTSIRGTLVGDDVNGWPSGHCYTMLAFDRASDKVRIRNPWGQQLGGQEITFGEYAKTWSQIAYED